MSENGYPVDSETLQRILVVDDDSHMRVLASQALASFGYQVDTVSDGSEAWEIIQKESYDLLITDNNMARLNGLELIKKVHENRIALPTILMSGKMPFKELGRLPWFSNESILKKPFGVHELLASVRTVLALP